jgi:hypothetical protein
MVEVASNWDTFTDCWPSYHIVAPAAHHTDTAPSTPPRLNPRCIQTRPTPRARPRTTRASMPRGANQRHIRARPPTQIMHRIRRHRPITSRTGAPGPKLLMTRPNRGEIARMSTRTGGGPSGVLGLLDHETQIRPRAQKTEPHRRKRGGAGKLHDCNGAARNTRQATTARLVVLSVSRTIHPSLSRNLCGGFLPSDPYSHAVTCHLCRLLACRPCQEDPCCANGGRS